jgi:hypothetical protein
MLLVGVNGLAGSGKDTFSGLVCEALKKKGYEGRIEWFAYGVKSSARDFFGWDGSKTGPGRSLLQQLGTELGRDYYEQFWVDAVAIKIGLEPSKEFPQKANNFSPQSFEELVAWLAFHWDGKKSARSDRLMASIQRLKSYNPPYVARLWSYCEKEFHKKTLPYETALEVVRWFRASCPVKSVDFGHMDLPLRQSSKLVVFLPDLRFQNEADLVHSHSGIVIQVVRPGVTQMGHASETQVFSPGTFDFTLNNDGGLGELEEQAKVYANLMVQLMENTNDKK